ncbi:MAG: hypothetical protein K2Y27_25615, partial [Xanthobacteraceae bacterium]|nr:hypothetical protein [Xanthobacteraceae bacterium]
VPRHDMDAPGSLAALRFAQSALRPAPVLYRAAHEGVCGAVPRAFKIVKASSLASAAAIITAAR